MEIKLHLCEGCGNVIMLDLQQYDVEGRHVLMDCPLCGCLNKVELETSGELVLTSPFLPCHEKDNDSKKVVIKELSTEVDAAIKVLLANGWKVKFIIDDL